MDIVDLCHLDNLKANFILHETQYVAIYTISTQKKKKLLHILFMAQLKRL
jgi:hypothetical protein